MGKLTAAQIIAIRCRYAGGAAQNALALEFGIARSGVSMIVTGQTWGHVGGPRTCDGRSRTKGEGHHAAKLTHEQVSALRDRFAAGESVRAIAADLPVKISAVSRTAHGKIWGDAPGPISGPRERPGPNHPRKVTEAQVRAIREKSAAGTTSAALAKEFEVSASTISRIVARRTWRHV